MVIYGSPGIVYDLIYFNLIYFNQRIIEDCILENYTCDGTTLFSHYESIYASNQAPIPSDALFPFFLFDGKRPSLLTAFFDKYFDFTIDSAEDFILKLSDTDTFKEFTILYYWNDLLGKNEIKKLLEMDGEAIAYAITLLSRHMNTIGFSYMLYHFPELTKKLINHLKALLPYIESFHKKNKNKIHSAIQNYTSDDNWPIISKYYINNSAKLVKQAFSVSLLNKFVNRHIQRESVHTYLLGYETCSMLPQIISYNYMSISSILEPFGHKLKREIIDLLHKHEMTISQLSRSLHISRTSIYRYVKALEEELIILKSNIRFGSDIYYKLNLAYLSHAKKIINDYIDSLLDETYKT